MHIRRDLRRSFQPVLCGIPFIRRGYIVQITDLVALQNSLLRHDFVLAAIAAGFRVERGIT